MGPRRHQEPIYPAEPAHWRVREEESMREFTRQIHEERSKGRKPFLGVWRKDVEWNKQIYGPRKTR